MSSRSTHVGGPAPRVHITPAGPLAIVLGGMAAFVMVGAVVGLLREQLHASCGIGEPGTEGEGTWTCADGIGYVGAVITLGGMSLLVVAAGTVVSLRVRSNLVARLCFTALAAITVGWCLAWTRYASSELVWSVPPGVESTDYWMGAVAPAAVAAGSALVLALAALAVPGRGPRILSFSAAGAMLVATILQPGLGVATLPALGLLLAAAFRTPVAERTRAASA